MGNLVGKSKGKSCGKSCGKILQEILWENLGGNLAGNLVGKSCGRILWKILWENIAGKSCGKSCRKILWETISERNFQNMHKMLMSAIFGMIFAILGLLQAIKYHQTIFFSCRGGSKLRFGGSYVKIGQELASGMTFTSEN